jgi:3-ketosteroid 9alpha-monooxygenase subunit A
MSGWYLVAFERDFKGELTPVAVGNRNFVLIRRADRICAFDATCPHRGANLACGGTLRDRSIVCPFHGYAIRLGNQGADRFFVREYPTLCVGGMIFVRTSDNRDNGWAEFAAEIEGTHFIVNGFEMPVDAPPEMVIDNAFDQRHFESVHGVRASRFSFSTSPHGALVVEGMVDVPFRDPRTQQFTVQPVPYLARIFSPGLAAVELRGPNPYTVITGATPRAKGGCTIRLNLAFPKAVWKDAPGPEISMPLLDYSRRGLEADRTIWENISPSIVPQWLPEDNASLQFLEFCKAHQDATDRA